MKTKIKRFKKIAGRILTGVLFLIIGGLIFLAVSPGHNLYLVRSESMKPTINVGDMIVTRAVKSISDSGIKPGAIVTYKHGKSLVTHRLIDVKTDRLLTKGDAMEENDPWKVTAQDVKDIYLFRIPYVGRLIVLVGTRLGWVVAIILPGIALMSLLIKDIVKEALTASHV